MKRRQFVCLPLATVALAKPRYVRLGVRTETYRAHPMSEAARLIKAAGFQGVHLGLQFADGRLNLNSPDWSYARRARDVFGEAGLPIFALDGYVNLVHPDPAVRESNVQSLAGLLAHARDFGAAIVATEAGSFHPGERGRERPDDPAAGWKQFIATLRELVKPAEANGVTLVMEPTRSTLVGTIEEVRRMLDDVGSSHFKLLWDAAHYYDPTNVNDVPGLLVRMYDSFGSEVVIAHANDFRVTAEGKVVSCGIGEGRLDYATYVELLESCRREMLLAVEHTPETDVHRVKTYLDRYFA